MDAWRINVVTQIDNWRLPDLALALLQMQAMLPQPGQKFVKFWRCSLSVASGDQYVVQITDEMLQSLQDCVHGLLVGIADANVAVEVRNQGVGHLTEIALFEPCDRMGLKLAVYQVLELNSPLRTGYIP